MVEENEASPLVLAAEQYSGVLKYATAFLATFTFRSARRTTPCSQPLRCSKGFIRRDGVHCPSVFRPAISVQPIGN